MIKSIAPPALLLASLLASAAGTMSQSAVAASENAYAGNLQGIRTLSLDSPYKLAGTPRYWSNKVNSEWLIWGSLTEPEQDFSIGVGRKSAANQYNGGLRRYLRSNKTLRIGKVLPADRYLKLSVHGGIFEALPFVFRDVTLRKKCLGFINKHGADKVLIHGWMCAPVNVIPSTKELECALSKLHIKGVLAPDNSSTWCSATVSPKRTL